MRNLFLCSIVGLFAWSLQAQPIAVCQNATVMLDPTGLAVVTPQQIDGGSSGGSMLINGQPMLYLNCAQVGMNTVQLSVTDPQLQVSTCAASLVVIDITPPVAIGQNRTVYLDSTGHATVLPVQCSNASTDNCAISQLLLNGQTSLVFDCSHIGQQTATLQAVDFSGNIGSAMVVITVLDTTTLPLSSLCNSDTTTVYLAANDSILLDPEQLLTTPLTGCWSLATQPQWFTLADLGYHNITLQFDHPAQSSASCASVIEIADPNAVYIAGTLYRTFDNCQSGQPIPYVAVELQPTGQICFTDAMGNYQFNALDTGHYTISLLNLPAALVPACPAALQQSLAAPAYGYYGGMNFMLSDAPRRDVAINIYTQGYVPGFQSLERLYVQNLGDQPESGELIYVGDPQLTVISAASTYPIALSSTSGDTMRFTYSNLPVAGFWELVIVSQVPSFLPLGTPVTACAQATINGATDDFLANNLVCLLRPVTGAFDPNAKEFAPFRSGDMHEGTIAPTDVELTYTLHFQNTGTAPAVNVVLRDTLQSALDPHTIASVVASHPCQLSIEEGNVLVARFDAIYLPDSSSDYLGSMGFLTFSIRRDPLLPVGTVIENRAGIYFDFNAPIMTNTVRSTIDEQTAIESIAGASFVSSIAPNPVQDRLILSYELDRSSSVQVAWLNVLGECLEAPLSLGEQTAGAYQVELSTAHLPTGLYFLKIQHEFAQKVHRVVKY